MSTAQFSGENVSQELQSLLTKHPKLAEITNGKMPRVLPRDLRFVGGADPHIIAPFGETSYFGYMGLRGRSDVPQERQAMQFATALIPVVKIGGKMHVVVTLRSGNNEAFPHTYLMFGGAGKFFDNGQPDPLRHILAEAFEEAAISRARITDIKLLGIVEELAGGGFAYSQPVYCAEFHPDRIESYEMVHADGSSEKFVHFGGIKAKGGKEVDCKVIPWTPEAIRALLTGVPMPEGLGDPSPRAWVPAGAMAYLELGRLYFGEQWYVKTRAARLRHLRELGRALGKI